MTKIDADKRWTPVLQRRTDPLGNTKKPTRKESRRTSSATKRSFVSRASLDDLYEVGKSLREKCPRESHADWKAPDNRPDPLHLMEESNKGRIPQADPDSPRTHAAVAVHLLSRCGAEHGRGPGRHAGDRAARAGVRRLLICSTSARSPPRNGE